MAGALRKSALVLGVLGLLIGHAFSQSSPNWPFGYVPSSAEWTASQTSKADVSNGTLTNPTITGGSISGASGSFTGLSASGAASLPGLTITPTGGTSARNIADILGDSINIRALGAKCDGSTDDSGAFLAAFAKPDGTTILIPKDSVCIIDPSTAGSLGVFRALSKAINLVGASPKTSIIRFKAGTSIVNSSGVFFYQSGSTNLSIRDLTIDVNGATPTNTDAPTTIIGIQGATSPTIRNVSIINQIVGSSGGLYSIVCNACSNFRVDSSYIQFSSASSTVQYKGIVTQHSLGTNTGGMITNNVLVNTNTIFTGAIQYYIAGNDISGWGVGAGVATGLADGSTNNTIVDNTIHDSQTATDPFGEAPNGIENWSPFTVIANNKLFHVAGTGIANGGNNALVSGNQSWDNSTGSPAGVGSGIASEASGGATAAGSVYTGNSAFDSGAGTQQYGYGECCGTVGSVTITSSNVFAGTVGAMKLVGTNGHVLGPPAFGNFALLTTSGTWTVPNTSLIDVIECGGGGAGGSVASGTTASAASGIPGMCVSFTATVTPGASMAYTIGAGGTPGAAGNNPGGGGGTTTFDGVQAAGGGGGLGSASGNAAAWTFNTLNASWPNVSPTVSVSVRSVFNNNPNLAGSSSTGGNGVGCLWSPRAVAVSNSAGTDAAGSYCSSGSGAGTTGASAFAGGAGNPGAIAIRW